MSNAVETYASDAMPLARERPMVEYGADGEARYAAEWRPEPVEYVVPKHLRIPKHTEIEGSSSKLSLTEALVQRIEALIITGASKESAKATCGVNPRLWRDWKARAREDKSPYAEAFQRFEMARAHVEVSANRMVTAVSQVNDPRVALAGAKLRLEYTNPARYAPQTRAKLDATVKVTGSVDVRALQVLATLTPEQLSAMLQGPSGLAPLLDTTAPPQIEAADEDE